MPVAGTDTGPQVKGTALIIFFKYLKTQPGTEALRQKILAALPASTAQVISKKVIAVADYPYSVFVDYLRALDRVLGKGDLAVCRKLGEYFATQNIQIVSEMFKQRPRPEDLMRVGDVFWRNYHLHSGAMKVEDSSPEHMVIRIDDFPQMAPAHCRLMEGWFSRAIVETGGVWIEDIHEVRCAARGDPFHEFVGRWRPGGKSEK